MCKETDMCKERESKSCFIHVCLRNWYETHVSYHSRRSSGFVTFDHQDSWRNTYVWISRYTCTWNPICYMKSEFVIYDLLLPWCVWKKAYCETCTKQNIHEPRYIKTKQHALHICNTRYMNINGTQPTQMQRNLHSWNQKKSDKNETRPTYSQHDKHEHQWNTSYSNAKRPTFTQQNI